MPESLSDIPGLDAFLAPAPAIAPTEVCIDVPVIAPLVAEYAPPPPEDPPAAAPKKGTGRPPGRPKSPWLARAEEEAKARAAQPLESLEDQLITLAMDPAGREVLVKMLDALAARRSFAECFKQAWKVMEPATELVWNWHLQLMCNVAQAVFLDWLRTKNEKKYVNQIRNLLVNVPPGSSKSKVFSVAFQAWCWLHWPGMKFICLSVNDDAAQRDARAMRDLIESDWYLSLTPRARGRDGKEDVTWRLREDQDAVSNFGNTVGGARLSMASRSVIVGLRGDCLAGATRVATATGDLTMEQIHDRAVSGAAVPLVWSVTPTGVLELKPVTAVRKLTGRSTVVVCTDANKLQCTPDHRIYSEGEYIPAARTLDRVVSILRWPEQTWPNPRAEEMRGVQVRDAHLSPVLGDVHASGCGVRQADETRPRDRSVLRQAMFADAPAAAGTDAAVPSLRGEIRAQRQEGPRHVFAEVSVRLASRDAMDAGETPVSGMRSDVRDEPVETGNTLQPRVRGPLPLGANAGSGELELLRPRDTVRPDVQRRDVASLESDHHGAGQPSLSGVWDREARAQGVARAPRRPRSDEQCAGEPHHAMRGVSHDTPSLRGATVLSVDPPSLHGRAETIDVYDITVEGNHNFFADEVLVHNCLSVDDANSPDENEKERKEVNTLWDGTQANRVNDLLRSLRFGIQQRTGAGDWSDHVIERQGTWWPVEDPENKRGPDGWLHVILPGEFEAARKFSMPECLRAILREWLPEEEWVFEDPRTSDGESIDKVRMPPEVLASEKKRWEGTGNYASQIQQRPALLEGARVRRDYWGWFRLERGVRGDIDDMENGRPRPEYCHPASKMPAMVVRAAQQQPGRWDFDWVCVSLDCAVKKTERGSNWGILVIAGKDGRRYVLDDRTQRGDILEIIDILRTVIRIWGPDKILIEDKAAGPDLKLRLLTEMRKGDMPMIELVDVKVGSDGKEARLDACISVIANGLVHLFDGAPWLQEFVDELAEFPAGRRNDRVDCLTQCLNHFKEYEGDAWPTL